MPWKTINQPTNQLNVTSIVIKLSLSTNQTKLIIIYTKLNVFSYCYIIQLVLFNMTILFVTVKWFQVLLFNTDNSIQY